MRIRSLLLVVMAMFATALFVSACTGSGDDDDDGFNPPTLVSIAVTGGTTVSVGSSLQFTATATFSDSTTTDITSTAAWSTSNAAIATVTAGLVTGVSTGVTAIRATQSTITGSRSVTVGSGVAPLQPITERFSFTNGDEIWLCLESQFAGSIVNISTDDDVGPACSDSQLGVSFASTVDEPQFHVLRLDHDGDGTLNCDTGIHRWNVDYLLDDGRCTGDCVNAEYVFNLAASSTFGAYCGDSGLGNLAALITSFEGYKAQTTGLLRLEALTGAYPITLTEFRLYTVANAFLSSCTASATIEAGATGAGALFHATCTPDLDTIALVPGTTYKAMLTGAKAGTSDIYGYIDLDFVASPPPSP